MKNSEHYEDMESPEVYVHDFGLIGKYCIISHEDEEVSLEFREIPMIIQKLQKVYDENKDYKKLSPEEWFDAHPEVKRD